MSEVGTNALTVIEGAQQKSRSDFHPGESAPSGDEVFTKKMREVPVKRGKLTRVPFHVSRLMEFCTERELVNQTGHNAWEWPLVVLKELVDNGLDACEEACVLAMPKSRKWSMRRSRKARTTRCPA
jgi:hypothetical protein